MTLKITTTTATATVVISHTCACSYTYLGTTAAAHCDCEAFPEEAHRNTGVSTGSAQPRHTSMLFSVHVVCFVHRVKVEVLRFLFLKVVVSLEEFVTCF